MTASRSLTAVFLLLLLAPMTAQWVAPRKARTASSLLTRLLTEKPTAASLREIEDDLAERSVTLAALRPVSQRAQFHLLDEAGTRVLRGRGGWLFYRPGVEAAVRRGPESGALGVIREWHAALTARGCALLVVPAPNKESVYPDFLPASAAGAQTHRWRETDALLAGLHEAGIPAVDLRETFAAARARGAPPLYLQQDTHWTPAGLAVAAEAIAVVARPLLPADAPAAFSTRPVSLERPGDLLAMLRAPGLLKDFPPEAIAATQVLDAAGQPHRSDPAGAVLLIGDSFLRHLETDEPGAAGLPSHLARALGQPVATLASDGGASTLVRQELFRRPDLLRGKRLVIWEFVERDLRLGAEGWASIPLPPE